MDGKLCGKASSMAEKQIDLLCRDPNNEIVTIEIAGCSDHEVHNALHCLKCGVKKHWVVCVDRKVMEGVKKKFSEFAELSGNEKVEVIVLSQALSENWNP